MNVQPLVPLCACPKCGAQAVVALTPAERLAQPDDTTHVCHPMLGGCNHGFTDERTREPEPARARAVLVMLSTSGAPVPAPADMVQSVPGVVAVDWCRTEREGDAVCVAARVQSRVSVEQLRANARTWGNANGWGVTVAPMGAL